MDLDQLTLDLQSSITYTSQLISTNETLHSTVQHLTASLEAAQTTLEEKSRQISELLKSTESHDISVLEKINELECNKERASELKSLRIEHDNVKMELKELSCREEELLAEYEREKEEDVKIIEEKCEDKLKELRRTCDKEMEEMREEVQKCKDAVVVSEKNKEEELVQMRAEYEAKLQAVQRAATTSLNTDIYKRKLAAQRSELMSEIECLRNELAQAGGRKGPRGGQSAYSINRTR